MSLNLSKVVTFNYTVKDEEGNVLDTTSNREPLSYLSGQNQIIPKLEETLNTMLIGGKKNVKIDAPEAYGEYKKEAVQEVKKSDFPAELEIEVGRSYIANSPEGQQMPFVIKSADEEKVEIDFNHPLAGKNLEFDVEVVDVRDATPEEMEHGHAHGAGGHQH